MKKTAIVRKNEISFCDILDNLRKNPKISKCGAIVSFIGIVRKVGHDKEEVSKLIYEHAEDYVEQDLIEIRDYILSNYDVEEVLIYHFTGELNPGDYTIFIVVAAQHRGPAFEATREALELVKKKVHIWKKEITTKSEYWILGDEIVDMHKSNK